MRATLVGVVAAVALVAAVPAGSAAAPKTCPAAWATGWQKLANKIQAPVYCPTWMPNPLDAKIGGQYIDINSIGKDRSYLISFLEHGDVGSGDVHVNFRGYPGRSSIPTCTTVIPNGKKTIRGKAACFSGANGSMRANGITATIYTVNQDADQWHILLAWHFRGSLYAVSEHVIPPYRFSTQVKHNLTLLLQSLVLVKPSR
jgi:hypothetical protein